MKNADFSSYKFRLNAALDLVQQSDLDAGVEVLLKMYQSGGVLYVIGNGGSASTATHMACDLSKGPTPKEKRGLVVWSLTDNPALTTAVANDISFDEVFSEPLRQRLRKNDVVLAISASGNSPNIVKGVEVAKSMGVPLIGMSGFGGGKLRELSDVIMHVESMDYGIVENVHLILNHYLVDCLRERLSVHAMDF